MRLGKGHGLLRTRNDTFKGYFLGSLAVLMWGVLPLLRLMAGEIPPLQLTSMSLFMASLVTYALHRYLRKPSRDREKTRASGDVQWSVFFLLGAVVFYFAALLHMFCEDLNSLRSWERSPTSG